MLESYVVGAVFKVVDESATTLTAIERRILAIDAAAKTAQANLSAMAAVRFTGASNSLAGYERRMTAISQRAGAFRTAMVENMEAVNTSMIAATETARAMAAALGEAAVAARAIGRANIEGSAESAVGGGGRRGGGGFFFGGRGPHFQASEKAGPLHVRSGVGLGLGAIGAGLYGAYEEAGVEDVAARLLYSAGKPIPSGMTGTKDFQTIRSMIQSTTSSGYAPSEVGSAMMAATQLLSDTAMPGGKRMSFDEMIDVQKAMMPFAITETRLKKGTDLEEALTSFIRLPHMTGRFGGKDMEEMARQFAYVSTKTDVPLPRLTNALSYSMPILSSELGMDPGSIMVMTAAMQRAGITNTKSGTWLREFELRSLPTTAQLTSHSQKQRIKALKELGMIDAKGKPTWLVDREGRRTEFVKGQEQNIDWQASLVKQSQVLQSASSRLAPDVRAADVRNAYGAQGGGVAGLESLKGFVDQMPVIMSMMKGFQPGTDFIGNYASNSPIQQGRQAIGDFKNVLMDIGTEVLPPVTSALRAFDDVLKAILGTLPHPKSAGGVAKDSAILGTVGAGIGFMLGGPPGAAIGGAIGAGGTALAEARMPKTLKTGLYSLPDVNEFGVPDMSSFSQAANKVSSAGPAAPPSVHIDSVVIQTHTDDPAQHAESFAEHLNRLLANSHQHNLGLGEGSLSSPYTSGGGP